MSGSADKDRLKVQRSAFTPRLLQSARLEALLACMEPTDCLYDVGTDHAYLALAALLSGRARTAIGLDIHAGPLKKAAENRARFACEANLTLRLQDGLADLEPQTKDVVVIAGMGGREICHILDRPKLNCQQILLQVNWCWAECRQFMQEKGYTLYCERLVEDQKLYRLLDYRPQLTKGNFICRDWVDFELGPGLLADLKTLPRPLLERFIQEEYEQASLKQRSQIRYKSVVTRLAALASELAVSI